MTLTLKTHPGIIDQFSLYDGPVRVAILADSKPEPIIVAGELPKGVTLADVSKLIEKRPKLKGGL